MANINSKWKRFLAVGCSHGDLADPVALQHVLDFATLWKPDTRLHLGDYLDTAAFRSGARGTKDETRDLGSDLNAAVSFLKDYRPDILFQGNHDDRLWSNAQHHNAIVSSCAQALISDIRAVVPKKCLWIEHYDIRRSYVQLGDTKFLHGFMYNENAIRDHAEHFGKCVFAHLHRVGSSPGRRVDSPVAYCVGYLGDETKFDYASRRRAISQWQNGFAWGEYSDKECMVWLCARNREGPWRLPI